MAQFVVALSKSHLPTAYYWLNPGSRGRMTRTNCDEAGDYVVPDVLSPRDLVSRPDNMDETIISSACPIALARLVLYELSPENLL